MLRLLIVQTGDYAEAWHRLKTGGQETFRDQRHSVEHIATLADQHEIVVLAGCDRVYDEMLAPNLRSIGLSSSHFWSRLKRRQLRKLLDDINPDQVVVGMPNLTVLSWAAQRGLLTLPLFADTFESDGPRPRRWNRSIEKALAEIHSPCVSNHSLAASQSLMHLNIPKDKIVPWEHLAIEANPDPKLAPGTSTIQLLFVGQASQSKGLGDCIEALHILHRQQRQTTLTVMGPGHTQPFVDQARSHGLIDFRGQVGADQVQQAMRDHDVVVVASRHDYAEGLPNTVYETLASRTPLVASDHPAIASRLSPGVDSMQFKAADSSSLAEQLSLLINDRELYERLSQHSAKALNGLYVGIERQALITLFVDDPKDKTGWVRRHSLDRLSGKHEAD